MSEAGEDRAKLGEEPPLIGDGRSGPPDRREVSARWLIGTFLTGVTSSILMGVALTAALNGREQLATPPEIVKLAALDEGSGEAAKTSRLVPPRTVAKASDRRRMEASTVIVDGEKEVVRTRPFVDVKMALAAGHTTTRDYPDFDPLAVFAQDDDATGAPTGQIYGAKVESEVSLRTVDFPLASATYQQTGGLTDGEVEKVVRNTGAILTDGDVQLASLHYVDPQRFGNSLAPEMLAANYGARVVQENVSMAPRDADDEDGVDFAEDIIVFNADRKISEAFEQAGYDGEDAHGMAEALAKRIGASALKAGTILRVGIETYDDKSRIMRGSVYYHDKHIRTVAIDDHGQFVPAEEPEVIPELTAAFNNEPPRVRARSDLPDRYDGIYRAAFSYGLTNDMTKQIVRLLASDVDLESRLDPSDRLEVLFSEPDKDNTATAESEILYLQASFGGKTRNLYRYQLDDGAVDYFDPEGESARQFLIRNPVPGARISRGFGMMRHPILGYNRMHSGVDYAIPRGTPIMAAGNGVIEKAGWSSGYGRQTVIRHNNGYETVYAHQNAIAKGMVPGAKVHQGQIIGYVGSTGLSTGPHCHFEIRVNGKPVNPLRVRLPVSRKLDGEELQAFSRERERIDALLADQDGSAVTLASR